MKKDASLAKQSGFTLIELVVTLAILGIVIVTIYSINQFGLRTFAQSSDRAENQFEVRMPADFIAKKVRYANNVEILDAVPTSTPTGAHEIFLDSGQLKYREYGSDSVIIGTQGVSNYSFNIQKKSGTDNMLQYVIGKTGTSNYDLVTDVIVLNVGNAGIAGSQSGIGIRYYMTSSDNVVKVSIDSLINPSNQFANIGSTVSLPKRVTANMSDGSTRQVSVSWNPANIDTSVSGIRSSSGKVVGYSGAVTINIAVGSYSIESVNDVSETVYKNQVYVMPPTVVANFTDGISSFSQNVPVTWSGTVDTSTVGTIEITGTVDDWIGNVVLRVQVNEISISSIDNIVNTVNQGTSFNLPSKVLATFSDGSIQSLDVTWSPSVADTSVIGTFNFSGYVTNFGHVDYQLNVVSQKLPKPVASIIENGNNGKVKIQNGTIGATVIFRKSNGDIITTKVLSSNIEETFTLNPGGLDNVYLIKQYWIDSDPFYFK